MPVTALVGFTSSFAVVIAGLHAVGASRSEAASGLLALCITQGVGIIWLTRRYRMPITLAWSTPGAAFLAGTGAVTGGWPAVVGAFIVVGCAFVLTGLWPALGRLITRIPTTIAQAMLAGVLLPLCLAPVTAVRDQPWAVLPVIAVWLLVLRFASRWAVPSAFVAAAIVIACDLVRTGTAVPLSGLAPQIDLTTPHLTWQAIVGVAIPLYIITMASQNIPGVAVMASFGYAVPWRSSMAVTGVGTIIGGPAGGHAINLAAISAALAAGPDAHPDRDKRWIAASTAGWLYLVLGVASAAVVTLVAIAPPGVMETVAGLALLGILATSLTSALSEIVGREAVIATFLVAASGVSIAGIGAAFWALVVGIVIRLVLVPRKTD
ncbi:MAG: benzoate transporter [Nocardioidaceae bacterium]|nr:benzoate transporter [Nocardioidaceae bacterium]